MIISQDQILNLHKGIETPALLVDKQQLEKNIRAMQQIADENGVKIRPHIKTHKSVYISKLLLKNGAAGITVAKLGEAEIMADSGIVDIFIANQITHPLKLERLKLLNKKINISIGVDHSEQIALLKDAFSNESKSLKVLIEIDSGLQRCGVMVGDPLIKLAKKIKTIRSLELKGIFTHAGQVYGSRSKRDIQKIGEHEGALMAQATNVLLEEGINVSEVSVGSTPTAPWSAKNPTVTEIRPGNYVFHDNIQYSLGSCGEGQWSLAVLATVISQPEKNRIVIDAGSKALNLDKGAHNTQLIAGFGRLLNIDGEIVRLSEEHGVIQLRSNKKVPIGSPVLIIPNHACAVVNLYDHFHLIN